MLEEETQPLWVNPSNQFIVLLLGVNGLNTNQAGVQGGCT